MSSAVLETHSASVEEDGTDIIKVNQYTLHGKLGEGAYGVVLEGVDNKQGKFAIKYVSKSLLKRQKEYTKVGRKMTVTTAFDDVNKEIALMKKLSHPKIVQLIEVIDDPDDDKLFMVMELVNGGQVMEWNKETKGFTANPRLRKPDGTGEEMSELCAKMVIRDVLIGLNYLHESHVVHRDLKPQNLLLTGDADRICVKIADFGVSHMFERLEQTGDNSAGNDTEKLTKVKGTYPFYAPECLEPAAFDGYRADIWALGVNLYCFLTGRLPFYDDAPPTLFDMITNNPIDFDTLANEFGCSTAVIDFTRRLLDKNPSTRPANAGAVISLKDPWLGEFTLETRPTLTELTEAEISAAFTPLDLSLHTVANLKIFAQKWRKRAVSNAIKRKEDELRKSMLSEQENPTPTISPAGSSESIPAPTGTTPVKDASNVPSKPATGGDAKSQDKTVSETCKRAEPTVINAHSLPDTVEHGKKHSARRGLSCTVC